MEEAKRAFPISEELLNAILGYLSIRPFNEVNNLIAAIQGEVQPVLEPAVKDQAAKEVKEERYLVAVPPKDKDKEEPKDQEPKKEE